jgi:REP element-mobilizing transposase RayT
MVRRKKRLPRQVDLFERGTWGGRRANSGRKAAPFRQDVPHRVRPRLSDRTPLHVTLRARVRSLRRGQVLTALRQQVKRVREEAGAFRIVHYSLQDNHLHLIVEAKDKRALSSGMLGFASALGRAINKLSRRSGKIWAGRYHARALTSPTAVRNALVYVLRNGLKHGVANGEDSFSSAYAFDGFASRQATPDDVVNDNGHTWLVRRGWRRRGLIRAHERPKAPPVRGIVIWDYISAAA